MLAAVPLLAVCVVDAAAVLGRHSTVSTSGAAPRPSATTAPLPAVAGSGGLPPRRGSPYFLGAGVGTSVRPPGHEPPCCRGRCRHAAGQRGLGRWLVATRGAPRAGYATRARASGAGPW